MSRTASLIVIAAVVIGGAGGAYVALQLLSKPPAQLPPENNGGEETPSKLHGSGYYLTTHHPEGADIDELRISEIYIDESVTMKRIKPRAKGRADRIFKRTSHITVKVTDDEN